MIQGIFPAALLFSEVLHLRLQHSQNSKRNSLNTMKVNNQITHCLAHNRALSQVFEI